jgi:hypothetical protein
MPHRANPLVPAVFAGTFAVAAVLGPNWTASAAEGCIEKPNLTHSGHWYYYVDHVRHRRCWFFEASRATVNLPSVPDQVPANDDSNSSWFSRLAAGVAQTFSAEPQQQNATQQISAFANPSTDTAVSPIRYRQTNKIVRRERPQVAPAATNGIASAARQDQSLLQPAAEKDDERSQLTTTDREALFKEFLKWYMERNIFGRSSAD